MRISGPERLPTVWFTRTRPTFSLRVAMCLALYVASLHAWADAWRFDFGALGPIRIGMTRPQFDAATGPRLLPLPPPKQWTQQELEECYYLEFDGFDVQFESGRVADIAITGSAFKSAPGGVGVGSRYDAVLRAFSHERAGQASGMQIGANHYDDRPIVTLEPTPAQQRRFGRQSISIDFQFGSDSLEPSSIVESISIGSHPIEGCA